MAAFVTTDLTDLRVADLMTIDPIVVSVDDSIEDAEEMLRAHRITGLPVVDLSGRLVGVVRPICCTSPSRRFRP
jgi:CBS domain-containing protein